MSDTNYWESWALRRASRRKALVGVGVGAFGITALASVGCGGDKNVAKEGGGGGSPQGGGGSPTPLTLPDHPLYKGLPGGKRGGRYVFAQSDAPVGADPHSYEVPGTHSMVQPVYNGLFMQWPEDPTRPTVMGELVEKWEQPSDTEVVLHLRKGVRFQDIDPVNGREFVADDVAFNIKRMQEKRPENRLRGMFTSVSAVEPIDKHTVRLKLGEPFAPLLTNLANTWASMVSKELVEKGDIDRKAIGTGGFVLGRWERGVSVEWKRNPNYWKAGLPFFDSMEMQVISDRALREAKYLAKEIDNGAINIVGTNEETIKKQKDEITQKVGGTFRELNSSFVAIIHVYFNIPQKPFDDLRVRKAFQHAIAYDQVIKLFAGRAIRTGPISSGNPPWGLQEADLPKFDPAQAKQLLAAAGFADGLNTETWVSTEYSGTAFAPLVAGLLKPLGINVGIKTLENAQWISEVYRGQGKYPMTSHADATFDDPDRILYEYFHSQGAANHTNLKDPKMDELAVKQRRELDTKVRQDLVRQAQLYILEQAYDVPIVSPGSIAAIPPWMASLDIRTGISDAYRIRDLQHINGGPRAS